MSSARITYAPRPDATPETELNALASVYSYILRCGESRRTEEKKGGPATNRPDDVMKGSNDDHARVSIQE